MDNGSGARSYPSSLAHVLAELARLDTVLRIQVGRMRGRGDPPADGLAAFYIPEFEVDELLDRQVGAPPWSAAPPTDDAAALHGRLDRQDSELAERTAASLRHGVLLRLAALAGIFRLAPMDVDIVVICLAPEFDRRYARLYAYLQDDVTRRAPTVELILNLVCQDIEAKMGAGRGRFTAAAPLLRHNLVMLEDDPGQRAVSLLDRNVRLDQRVAGFLLDDDAPDARLEPYARIVAPTVEFDELHFPAEFVGRLTELAANAGDDTVFHCRGPYGAGKRTAAQACCASWGAVLLEVRGAALAGRPADEFRTLLELADREARLQGAVLYWTGFDAMLAGDRHGHLRLLLDMLRDHPAPAFLAGEAAWEPSGAPDELRFVRIEPPRPGHGDSVRLWRAALATAPGTDAAATTGADTGLDLDALAGKFDLSGGQIDDAVATARSLAWARDPESPAVTTADLYEACRRQSNRTLGELAQHIVPRHGWDDLVLPADRMAQLREIHDQIRYRAVVYESWGFERKVAYGLGTNVLFAGPSGTGKTMAADVLAHALGLDLYKVDLSTVVSKYIGETEKNLGRIFAEARTSNAVLFFDEADALFGRRTQVRDAHDRYANLETSYLLQKLEEHEGVVILATNLRKNMDEAFVRRLAFTVDFPLPDVDDRRRIWNRIWPADAPRDAIDLDLLARQIDMPGGNIRNIALAGAFLAAADGGSLTMDHLLRAARREYQKLGKVRPIAAADPQRAGGIR